MNDEEFERFFNQTNAAIKRRTKERSARRQREATVPAAPEAPAVPEAPTAPTAPTTPTAAPATEPVWRPVAEALGAVMSLCGRVLMSPVVLKVVFVGVFVAVLAQLALTMFDCYLTSLVELPLLGPVFAATVATFKWMLGLAEIATPAEGLQSAEPVPVPVPVPVAHGIFTYGADLRAGVEYLVDVPTSDEGNTAVSLINEVFASNLQGDGDAASWEATWGKVADGITALDREEAAYASTTAVDALLAFQRASALRRELDDAPTSAHRSLKRGSNGSSSSASTWAGAAWRGSDKLRRRMLALVFGAGSDDGLSPAQRQVERRVGALEAIVDGLGSGSGGAADGGSVLDPAIRLGPLLKDDVCKASERLRGAADLADDRRDRAFERERRRMLEAPGAGKPSPSRNGHGDMSVSEGAALGRAAYDLRYHDVIGAVMCEEATRTTAGLRAAKKAMSDFARSVQVIRSELCDLREVHAAVWSDDDDDDDAVRVDRELRRLVVRFLGELKETFF